MSKIPIQLESDQRPRANRGEKIEGGVGTCCLPRAGESLRELRRGLGDGFLRRGGETRPFVLKGWRLKTVTGWQDRPVLDGRSLPSPLAKKLCNITPTSPKRGELALQGPTSHVVDHYLGKGGPGNHAGSEDWGLVEGLVRVWILAK